MRGYTQLTQEERYQIYILKKAEYSQTEIAKLLHHQAYIHVATSLNGRPRPSCPSSLQGGPTV